MLKRRSNEDILQFIRDLPGGNVPQYAKLLGTTPNRINALMNTKEGEKLARANKVVASERGALPTWTFTEQRGCLRGRDVTDMVREGRLPPFISEMLGKIHADYQEDALEFLREALDQTSNHRAFEDQIVHHMEQTQHYSTDIMQGQALLAQRDAEIARFDRVLEQARNMAGLLEDQTQRQAERLPSSGAQSEADEAAPAEA